MCLGVLLGYALEKAPGKSRSANRESDLGVSHTDLRNGSFRPQERAQTGKPHMKLPKP